MWRRAYRGAGHPIGNGDASGYREISTFGSTPLAGGGLVPFRSHREHQRALLVFSTGTIVEGGFASCGGRPAAAEIFQGITYGCKQLEPSEEANGVVHWVRINLTAALHLMSPAKTRRLSVRVGSTACAGSETL